MVEDYLLGTEYRLCVGRSNVSSLITCSGNVIGDGVDTVAELVAVKNDHPYGVMAVVHH